MIYMRPDEYGCERVTEWDAFNEPYEFDIILVVRELATRKLYAAFDSGCSCPIPFEDHTFPTDFTEIRSLQDLMPLIPAEFPYRRLSDVEPLYRTVKEALCRR